MPIISLIIHYLQYITYKDYIEILFFSALIYYFTIWISKDAHKNLLFYFYGYSTLIGLTYMAQLNTIYFFLTFFAPVITICFIILNETTLQKNYVMLRNTITPKKEARDWLEHLMRICLQNMNNNISLTCIIEQTDNLNSILKDAMLLETDLHTGILEMLIQSPTFKADNIIWLNKYGTLIGINAQWRHPADQIFVDESVKKLTLFKQDALLYTAKTDALFFRSNPHTHTFDIIAHGTLFESITANTVLQCLKKYLNDATTIKKGTSHETISRHNNHEQLRT